MILERICIAEVVEVNELASSERGEAGFGSTGVAQESKNISPDQLKRARVDDASN